MQGNLDCPLTTIVVKYKCNVLPKDWQFGIRRNLNKLEISCGGKVESKRGTRLMTKLTFGPPDAKKEAIPNLHSHDPEYWSSVGFAPQGFKSVSLRVKSAH